MSSQFAHLSIPSRSQEAHVARVTETIQSKNVEIECAVDDLTHVLRECVQLR